MVCYLVKIQAFLSRVVFSKIIIALLFYATLHVFQMSNKNFFVNNSRNLTKA